VNPTLYDVLGVSPDASGEEIRDAWREAADRFDPGQGGSTKQFRLFNEAAEVLLDPERRRAYDLALAEDEPGEAPVEETSAGRVPGPPMPGASSAAAPTPSAEGAPVEPVVPAPRARSGRSTTLLVVLGVLTLVAVAAAAYFGSRGWSAYQADRQAERYQQALDRAPAAAESAAAAVLSYDHRSLEADRDAAARFLTEDYREEYVQTFDQLVMESAEQTEAEVEAEVLASAPMNSGRRDASRVPVLLFVNQTTVSNARAEPSVALNRVRLDMVEVEGTWLVDAITSY
jgi:Mce-associated membrane protein